MYLIVVACENNQEHYLIQQNNSLSDLATTSDSEKNDCPKTS
jgi:hypothetical protein